MKVFKRSLPFLLILAIILSTGSAVTACPACPGYVEDPLYQPYNVRLCEPSVTSTDNDDYGTYIFGDPYDQFIGYDFIGWYTSSVQQETTYDSFSLYKPGDSVSIYQNTTFYALHGKISEDGYEYYTTEMDFTQSPFPIGHTLSLENGIAVNYLIKEADLEQYDTVDITIRFPIYSSNYSYDVEITDYTVKTEGEYQVYTISDVNATQMNEEIRFEMKLKKDGKVWYAKNYYSIATYAYSQLNKETASDSLKTLCANLLQYGTLAQKFKNHRTDTYADRNMTDVHRSYLTDLNTVEFETTNKEFDDLDAPSVLWMGKTLDLQSNVTLKAYIDCSNYTGDPADLRLQIRYIDLNGYEHVTYGDKCTVYNKENKQFTISFAGLRATELRLPLALSIVDYNGTQVSNTVHYSVATYGTGKSGTLLSLCQALLAYSDAAVAFVSSR